jgi:hypothetical protein
LESLVKATPSPIRIKAASPRKKVVTLTPQASADTDTDAGIKQTVGTKKDPQTKENVYSPQDETYISFVKGLDNNGSSAPQSEKDLSCWIRSVEESFEQHHIHPRELFPEPQEKKSQDKKVAFSSDHTVRFFSRSKEELMQLRRRKKKRGGNVGGNDKNNDSFEEQPFLRYFEEKLKTTEDFVKTIEVSLQSGIVVVSDFFQPEKAGCVCPEPESFKSPVEKDDRLGDITPSNNSLADSLLPDDDDENSLKEDEPRRESCPSNTSKNLTNNATRTSSNSKNSGVSGLWFAVPYKPPSNDGSLDFLQPADPKVSPETKSNGKHTSSSCSISLDKKKEVVEAAKRWAASQKDFFHSAHQQLGIAPMATETTAETYSSSSQEEFPDLDENTISSSSISPDQKNEVLEAAKRWAAAQKDFFDSAHQQLGISVQDTENTAETSHSSSPEDGPDLDEPRNSSLAPPSVGPEGGPDPDEAKNYTETAQESNDWEAAEFGPDLDESRESEHQDPHLRLSGQWESFEHETFTATKVTQKTAVEDTDWPMFPSAMADLPALSQDAPDMDEGKEWKAFQEGKKEESPKMSIRARLQAAPRKERKTRIANFNRSRAQENLSNQDAPYVKQAPHETLAPIAREQEKYTSRVKEMALAIEQHRAKEMASFRIMPRASPSNVSVASSLTVNSSIWAEDGKESPAKMSELQFPVLDCECRPDDAQPSPVSVTLL